MEEKEILLKTIEGLNASIASLSTTNKNQSEQIKNLQERIKELTAQVAWLNRQLFGRKSEKLRVYDPNMPDLFYRCLCGIGWILCFGCDQLRLFELAVWGCRI